MHGLKATVTFLTVVAALAAAGAEAAQVRFYVDGALIAELPSDTVPSGKPLKLAGRSGAGGTDEDSGLLDNVCLMVGGAEILDEPFEDLNLAFWGRYGSPLPRLLTGSGNPEPCLMTAGDADYDSGIYSLEGYDWRQGFFIQADAYVDIAASYHAVEFGVARVDEPSGDSFPHDIGINWKTTGAGDHVFVCSTELEQAFVPADDHLGRWTTIAVTAEPYEINPITIRFYVDDVLIAELPSQQQPRGKPLKIAGRSGADGTDEDSGLLDNVCLKTGRADIFCEPFDELDLGFWGRYGSPLPRLLTGAGNPKPCLMTAGDANYDSGLYSLSRYDWRRGFLIQADAYVDIAASYHAIEVGIARLDEPSGDSFPHDIGINWKTTGAGDHVFVCSTELEQALVPADDHLGQWTTIVVTSGTLTAVEQTTWGAIKALFR